MKSKKNNKQLVYDRLDKLFNEELILNGNHGFFNTNDRAKHKYIISYFSDKKVMSLSYMELLAIIIKQIPTSNLNEIIFLKPETLSNVNLNIQVS